MGIKDKMLGGGDQEVVEGAVRICRGYLNGAWKKVTSNDIKVKRLSGGLSNILYHIQMEGEEKVYPKEVLLRIYGQTHSEGAIEHLITESVIFTLLSERRIGPKLYGVFPGGRIEEFIPAAPLTTQELGSPEISVAIAERLAAVHNLSIPINKEPKWIWDTMNRWAITIQSWNESNALPDKEIAKVNFQEEIGWLWNHLKKVPSPVVFCHNDLQEGNILHRKINGKSDLVFIDFEYCAYNYRGFDIANHFIEWTYDYTHKEYPFFSVHKENAPSADSMKVFLEQYLKSMYPNGQIPKPDVNNLTSMLNEVKQYTMASHLLWTVWAIVNAHTSSIPFGYWEYAAERFECYLKLKSDVLHSSKETPSVKRKKTD